MRRKHKVLSSLAMFPFTVLGIMSLAAYLDKQYTHYKTLEIKLKQAERQAKYDRQMADHYQSAYHEMYKTAVRIEKQVR